MGIGDWGSLQDKHSSDSFLHDIHFSLLPVTHNFFSHLFDINLKPISHLLHLGEFKVPLQEIQFSNLLKDSQIKLGFLSIGK